MVEMRAIHKQTLKLEKELVTRTKKRKSRIRRYERILKQLEALKQGGKPKKQLINDLLNAVRNRYQELSNDIFMKGYVGDFHMHRRLPMRWQSSHSAELGTLNNIYSQLVQNENQYSPESFQYQQDNENTTYDTAAERGWIYDQGQRWRL